MLNCRACLWRSIQALNASAPRHPHLRRDAAAPVLLLGQQRLLRTEASSTPTTTQDAWSRSRRAAALKRKEKAALSGQPVKQSRQKKPLPNIGRRDPSMSQEEWTARKMELLHLRDPLKLADFVKSELAKGRFNRMLQLVVMASHSMQCTVSWNHLIDHLLKHEEVSKALKVYNDMKKRSQFPDSYTYTIILRGLSMHAQRSGILGKGLSIYHSMFAHNSRVEPTIIHTNAMLQLCSRASDMDALWGVAAKIPETGPGSADIVTYSIILNALRHSLLVDAPTGEGVAEVAARRERGIVEGRRMWEGIVRRWRNADIVMEDSLVCAMGRLLLIGRRPDDWDDVLSLVEQTMDIPRLVPRLGTFARQLAGLPRLRALNVLEHYRDDDKHSDPAKGHVRGDEFLSISPEGVGSALNNPLNYAQPSRNTLSMILEACQKIVAIKASKEYWDMLTDPTTYAIVPDVDNLHAHLRMLRQGRASAATVECLNEGFVANGIPPQPKTFRIAMSTCVREKNNHNSLKHASQLLSLMTRTLEDVDSKAVMMYANLALDFPLATGEDLIGALTLLYPAVKSIRLQISVGIQRPADELQRPADELQRPADELQINPILEQQRRDAFNALSKVYSVYDRLIFSNLIGEERKGPFKDERARLSSYLNRLRWRYGQNEAHEELKQENGSQHFKGRRIDNRKEKNQEKWEEERPKTTSPWRIRGFGRSQHRKMSLPDANN